MPSTAFDPFPRSHAFSPYMLSVLRIVAALLFLSHGSQKLLGFPPSQMHPPLLSMLGIGGVFELFGGLLLLVGLLSRWVAFILAGEMAVAYFAFHAPKSFFPALNGGDAAILFCFLFLYIVFRRSGTVERRCGARAQALTPLRPIDGIGFDPP